MWSGSSSPTANMWTLNRARSRSSAPRKSMRLRGSAAWVEISIHERSGTRAPDARPHRGRDHDGIPHGVHADGARYVLRLHRVLRPDPSVHREQGVRADGPAHL